MLKPAKYRDPLGAEKKRKKKGQNYDNRPTPPAVLETKPTVQMRKYKKDDKSVHEFNTPVAPETFHKLTEGKYKQPVGLKKGGKAKKSKSRVNEAGNYTKPGMRKRLFNRIKAGGKGGRPGQWSARKAQMLAAAYKKAGGGYKN